MGGFESGLRLGVFAGWIGLAGLLVDETVADSEEKVASFWETTLVAVVEELSRRTPIVCGSTSETWLLYLLLIFWSPMMDFSEGASFSG